MEARDSLIDNCALTLGIVDLVQGFPKAPGIPVVNKLSLCHIPLKPGSALSECA